MARPQRTLASEPGDHVSSLHARQETDRALRKVREFESFEQLRQVLPGDLILAHTSDQPLQVKENINLFMRALVEAIILVVIVSLLGFWEWRLALIMALAIPITLAMTFGVVYVLGIDLQQVSIASLIIALGLLVDVPVVSGDGIKAPLG